MGENSEQEDEALERPSLASVIVQMVPIVLLMLVVGGGAVTLQWYGLNHHPDLYFKIMGYVVLGALIVLPIVAWIAWRLLRPMLREMLEEQVEEAEPGAATVSENGVEYEEVEYIAPDTISIRSIDSLANAYSRHRFAKTFLSSFLLWAIAVAVVGAMTASTVELFAEDSSFGPLARSSMVAVGVCLLLLVLYFLAAFLGIVFEYIHRRIMGLFVILIVIASVYNQGRRLLAYIEANGFVVAQDIVSMLIAASYAVLPVVFLEFLLFGIWLVSARDADFLAVRGWRASLWRLHSAFRRHIGLPQFLSFVKAKTGYLALLYFLTAVLTANFFMIWYLPQQVADIALIEMEEDAGDYWNAATAIVVSIGVFALYLLGAGSRLMRAAQRRATDVYQSIRERDERAPVLFLRAFDQDRYRLKSRFGDPFTRLFPAASHSRTIDEILLESGTPYGPVIAIGDPADPIPPLGAARVFVENEGANWQEVVHDLTESSNAIVMCPSPSEGVLWELDLIASLGAEWRTVFLARPDMGREEALALCAQILPEVPEIPPNKRLIAFWQGEDTWQVLIGRRESVESYVVALSMALQDILGVEDWLTEMSQLTQAAIIQQVSEYRNQRGLQPT